MLGGVFKEVAKDWLNSIVEELNEDESFKIRIDVEVLKNGQD